MFRPVLLWPSSGCIHLSEKLYWFDITTTTIIIIIIIIIISVVKGNEISFYLKSVVVCVQMVTNQAYKMCYPVCLWQCSVRVESVHAPWGAEGLGRCLVLWCSVFLAVVGAEYHIGLLLWLCRHDTEIHGHSVHSAAPHSINNSCQF